MEDDVGLSGRPGEQEVPNVDLELLVATLAALGLVAFLLRSLLRAGQR